MSSYCKQGNSHWVLSLISYSLCRQYALNKAASIDFQFPARCAIARAWYVASRPGGRAWTLTLSGAFVVTWHHVRSRWARNTQNGYAWVLQAEITRLLPLFTNPTAVDKCLLCYRVPIGGRQNHLTVGDTLYRVLKKRCMPVHLWTLGVVVVYYLW